MRAAKRIPARFKEVVVAVQDQKGKVKLHGIGGKILRTSVSHEDAAKLQAPLSAAK
jgi:uncharacterized membrane protein